MADLDFGNTIRGFAPGQQVFNRFSLQRILGRGGMGVVWLARDDELEREIALKFLPEIVALDRESVTELKRETRRNLELTHPHIVRIYDFAQDSRTAAISMEFINGSSLSAAKVDRPGGIFEFAEVKRWTTQLCEALSYAHGRARVVHRDLKPANLMIDAAGELKVTDFGIACSIADSVSRVSKNIGSSGTPVYMSPQQMMGERPCPSDDIYAVGATLFELLAGKPPFYTGNIILQVQSKVPVSIAARREELGAAHAGPVPENWERAIAACLAKDPAARPASVLALAEMLGLEGTFIPPPAVTPVAPAIAKATPVVVEPPVPAAPLAQCAPEKAPVATKEGAPQPRRRGGKGGWIGVGAAIVVLAAAGVWVGDVPNRFKASKQMEEARTALARSEWVPAFTAFRAATVSRPTNAQYDREFARAQEDWVRQAREEIANADSRTAFDRLQAMAVIAELLTGPAARDFQELVDSRRAEVQEVVRQAIATARARAEAENFGPALDALAAVRGHAALAPEFATAEKEIRIARLRHAMESARQLSLDRQFDAGQAALDVVREDAALLPEDYAGALVMVKELRVADGLDGVLAGPRAASADFARAFAALDELRKYEVLPEEMESTAAEIRRRAEEFSIERLARALVAGNAPEADAAVADYAKFTNSTFRVTGSELLATRELAAFIVALEQLRVRPASGQPRQHGRDIALVAAMRAKFNNPEDVKAFLGREFSAWSTVEEAAGRPGLALYLLGEARREGATIDAAREKRLRDRLPADVGLKLAWAAPKFDAATTGALRTTPVQTIRAAVEKQVAGWFPTTDKDAPGVVWLTPAVTGPVSTDKPARERKSVRYQSGTRQVNNPTYRNLLADLENAQDTMRRAAQARANAEAEAKRQAAASNDQASILASALAGGIAVGVHANTYNKASNEANNIRARLQRTPRTLSEPVYSDEPYDVITHNVTYTAELMVGIERFNSPLRWRAEHAHRTVEITGNRDRGVPVQAPNYLSAAAQADALAKKLAEQAGHVAPVLKSLSESSLEEVAERSKLAGHDALTRADDLWGLLLMWRGIKVEPAGAGKVEQVVRSALGLPSR